MDLSREPRRIAAFGLRQLTGGFRRGNAAGASLGMAALLYAFGAWRRRPKEELIYSRKLRDGEAIEIRKIRGSVTVEEDAADSVPDPG